MTKKMKIKRLKQQNIDLMKQNMKLRQKIPLDEYAQKMDKSLEKFDQINDDLMELYQQLHVCHLKNKKTAMRYRLGILLIKWKQFFRK